MRETESRLQGKPAVERINALTYEDGTRIVGNYTDGDVTYEGRTVAPHNSVEYVC